MSFLLGDNLDPLRDLYFIYVTNRGVWEPVFLTAAIERTGEQTYYNVFDVH